MLVHVKKGVMKGVMMGVMKGVMKGVPTPSRTPHLDSICQKIQQCVYFLRRLRSLGASSRIIALFHTSVIRSALLYCSTVWFRSLTAKMRTKLPTHNTETMWVRFTIRWCPQSNGSHYRNMLNHVKKKPVAAVTDKLHCSCKSGSGSVLMLNAQKPRTLHKQRRCQRSEGPSLKPGGELRLLSESSAEVTKCFFVFFIGTIHYKICFVGALTCTSILGAHRHTHTHIIIYSHTNKPTPL